MKQIKAHWKALVAALLLLLALAWYSRPVDIYALTPGIKEADQITLSLREFGTGGSTDFPIRNLTPEDPEWNAAQEAIESLRFRRPPWNLLLQFLPSHSAHGRATRDGDHHVTVTIFQREKGWSEVQFFIDEWMYYSPHSNRNLTLWTANPRETGDALAETLRPLLEES